MLNPVSDFSISCQKQLSKKVRRKWDIKLVKYSFYHVTAPIDGQAFSQSLLSCKLKEVSYSASKNLIKFDNNWDVQLVVHKPETFQGSIIGPIRRLWLGQGTSISPIRRLRLGNFVKLKITVMGFTIFLPIFWNMQQIGEASKMSIFTRRSNQLNRTKICSVLIKMLLTFRWLFPP